MGSIVMDLQQWKRSGQSQLVAKRHCQRRSFQCIQKTLRRITNLLQWMVFGWDYENNKTNDSLLILLQINSLEVLWFPEVIKWNNTSSMRYPEAIFSCFVYKKHFFYNKHRHRGTIFVIVAICPWSLEDRCFTIAILHFVSRWPDLNQFQALIHWMSHWKGNYVS